MSLLRPEWLLALPLIALLAGWLMRRAGRLGAWEQAARPELLRALQALGQVQQGGRPLGLLLAMASAALLASALAGPATERRAATSFRNLDGVIFVLDVSSSMIGTEVDSDWPRVLAAARMALSRLGSRPAALVLFGGDAYVGADLSRDLRQLGQTLTLLDGDTMPDPGSRPERGLALAAQMLDSAQIIGGDVLLISDGGGMTPATLALAETITRHGARLSTLGDARLRPLAQVGGGRHFTLDQPEALAAFLSDDARTRLEADAYPLLFKDDLGRWLLALALLPLLLLFRRRRA